MIGRLTDRQVTPGTCDEEELQQPKPHPLQLEQEDNAPQPAVHPRAKSGAFGVGVFCSRAIRA